AACCLLALPAPESDLSPAAQRVAEAGAAAVAPVVFGAPPRTIRLWRRALDGSTDSCAGRVDVLLFEPYLKGVLPQEWIPGWPTESLRAGALAARSYAWFWIGQAGRYRCADLDDPAASQVFRESTYAATNAAVDATSGQAIVREGAVVLAEYAAENGDPTADGVAEPHCTGFARNGHGRGM